MDNNKDSRAPKPETEPVRHWTFEAFKSNLIRAVTVHPATMASLPQTIDTGIFGQETDALKAQTKVNPKHPEYALASKLNLQGRIELQKQPIEGANDSVALVVPRKRLVATGEGAEKYSTMERYVLLTHSHPYEAPASPLDIGIILEDLDEAGFVAIMVGIDRQNLLFIRTLETPEMSPDQTTQWVKKWTDEYHKRVAKFPSYLTGAARLATAAVMNNNLLREMTDETYIAAYSTSSGNVYTRAVL